MTVTPRASATLDAVLERLTYVNEETGYTVARVATDRGPDLLTEHFGLDTLPWRRS